ncbi:MAG: hypothetical protein M3N95_10890 [Actinomycetota bacterium]|nr:hypothetical protein [Actinomycetota bacterium]
MTGLGRVVRTRIEARSRRPASVPYYPVRSGVAVLDDAGVTLCPAIGWSIGVNTCFQLAVDKSDRLTGILAVAGVPGATFASVGAPLLIPRSPGGTSPAA